MLSTRQPEVSIISPTPSGATVFHLYSVYLPEPPASGGCLFSKKPSERGFNFLRLACRVGSDTQQAKREKTMSVIRLGPLMLCLSQWMASITATISIKAERTPCDTEVRKNSQDSSGIQAGGAENGSQTYNFNE